MKKYIIPKGCHYSNFIPTFKCLKNEISLYRVFEFTESCRYGVSEKSCVNKLFGFCFGFGVHENSLRFGWTYIDQIDSIFIYAYRYLNGKLIKDKIYELEIGERKSFIVGIEKSDKKNHWNCKLYVDGHTVCNEEIISDKKFITTLGPYFGGNSGAPHKIIINQL